MKKNYNKVDLKDNLKNFYKILKKSINKLIKKFLLYIQILHSK